MEYVIVFLFGLVIGLVTAIVTTRITVHRIDQMRLAMTSERAQMLHDASRDAAVS